MTDQHHPAESPQPPLRRPGRARTNRPVTHPHPRSGRPTQSLQPLENTLPTTRPASPEGAASRRDAPPDADRRSTKTKFHAFLAAASEVLADQPSKAATRAAGTRMQHALAGLVHDAAGGKPC